MASLVFPLSEVLLEIFNRLECRDVAGKGLGLIAGRFEFGRRGVKHCHQLGIFMVRRRRLGDGRRQAGNRTLRFGRLKGSGVSHYENPKKD